MRRTFFTLFAIVGLLVSPLRAADGQAVNASIRRGIEFIYSKQLDTGTWESARTPEEGGTHFGGRTALATYALLAAGESHVDPRVDRAVRFLRTAKMPGHYSIGLRAQLWTLLPPTRENTAAMEQDARLLIQGMIKRGGPNAGLYDYTAGPSDRVDLSVSQYGVLGLWAVAQRGFPLDKMSIWRPAENAWIRFQERGGGWNYDGSTASGGAPTASMTAAGIATLFITQEFLHADVGLLCTGNVSTPAIDSGLARAAAFWPRVIGGGVPWQYYTLYGYERIGRASGYKYLDGRDWFEEGTAFLLENQNPDGSWGQSSDIIDTSFALLFLSRGREMVAINKIRYSNSSEPGSKVGTWNQRPRDVASAVRLIGRDIERTLNWQIIDLDAASIDDLHDAPIAYFAGSDPLSLTDDAKAKLKDYVERGGLLVFNADCAKSQPFRRSARTLVRELFPNYPPRILPADHPLLSNQLFDTRRWKVRPQVEAVDNGVRLLAVFLDDDPARAWQSADVRRADSLQWPTILFQYAVDKSGAWFKGVRYRAEKSPAISSIRTVRVARLKWDGNFDPEPGGYRQLAAVMHNLDRTTLEVDIIEPGVSPLDAFRFAHLTGTGRFAPGDRFEAAIKVFVEKGGTLLVDAAGGDAEFATDVEAMLTRVFGSTGLPIEDDDALFQRPNAIAIDYRPFSRKRLIGGIHTPRLRAIEVDGRRAVFYSREDLSAGLVGQSVDGIDGYTPAAASAIVRRIFLETSR